MLTEVYIEALLVDGDLADQVWEDWDQGEIDDSTDAWELGPVIVVSSTYAPPYYHRTRRHLQSRADT